MSWCLGETSFDSHENNIPKEKSSGGWMRNRVDGGSEKYDYNKRHYEQNLSEFWIIYGDIGGVDTLTNGNNHTPRVFSTKTQDFTPMFLKPVVEVQLFL